MSSSENETLLCVDWATFVQDGLLKYGLTEGAAVLTCNAQVVDSYGEFSDLDESNWSQFRDIFRLTSSKHVDQLCSRSFNINFKTGFVKFRIFQKSLTSIYCISENRSKGLIVCSIPNGIIVAVYNASTRGSSRAIQAVERFCDRLRA